MTLFKQYPNLEIIQSLAKQSKVKVHLVGGFLRDFVLEREGCDFDFAVEKRALKLAQVFADKIKGAYIVLDEQRGCARVVKKKEGRIYSYDFSDYRAKTFLEDLKDRDFTVNTLSLNLSEANAQTILSEAIVDHTRAMKDIKDKRIKRVSIRAFRDDPLRMMRAFSLKANYGFKIELKTLNQIRKEKELIKNVSYERIREELFKVLESEKTFDVLNTMDRSGLLEHVIPQLHVMFKCKQGGYHHLDVWPHSLEAVRQLEKVFRQQKDNPDVDGYLNEIIAGDHSRRSLIKLATLLHDIGKPDTRKKEGNKLSFHGHENVGKHIVKAIALMLKISTKERHAIEDMVQLHLRPGYLSNFKKPSERMIFRYFRDAKDETASVLLLSLADQRATRGPLTSQEDQKHHEKICLQLVDRYFEKKKEKPFVPLVDGNYIMKKLKLKPSPLVGKILTELEEAQVLGKITTKKEALEVAEGIIKK